MLSFSDTRSAMFTLLGANTDPTEFLLVQTQSRYLGLGAADGSGNNKLARKLSAAEVRTRVYAYFRCGPLESLHYKKMA